MIKTHYQYDVDPACSIFNTFKVPTNFACILLDTDSYHFHLNEVNDINFDKHLNVSQMLLILCHFTAFNPFAKRLLFIVYIKWPTVYIFDA